MRLRRWGVYSPNGVLVSTHWTHRGAFWAARGHSLKESRPRLWPVRQIG